MLLAIILLTICAPGPRDNCVVDGDTWWIDGEKFRLADIDAPELHGRCASETALAIRARDRLQALLNAAERSAPRRKDRPQRVKGERYPFSRQGWDRKWRRALKDAGIEGYRFHNNRHTAATRSGSIEAANQLLGHSDYRTTQRYFHPGEDQVREAMIAAESRNSPEPVGEQAENPRKAANDA